MNPKTNSNKPKKLQKIEAKIHNNNSLKKIIREEKVADKIIDARNFKYKTLR
jgi:hypothetical protein